jgi:hypothetical protein
MLGGKLMPKIPLFINTRDALKKVKKGKESFKIFQASYKNETRYTG